MRNRLRDYTAHSQRVPCRVLQIPGNKSIDPNEVKVNRELGPYGAVTDRTLIWGLWLATLHDAQISNGGSPCVIIIIKSCLIIKDFHAWECLSIPRELRQMLPRHGT